MSVPISLGASFEAGVPVQLFQVASPVGFTRRVWYASYDVSTDGQRFLVDVVEDSTAPQIAVVLNWQSALNRN